MTEVAADLSALDAFSDRTVGRRDQLDQVRCRLSAVRLPRDAFGYIPGIGGRIHDAYEDFVDSCTEAAAEITEATYSLSQGVRNASEAYSESDQSSAGRLRSTDEIAEATATLSAAVAASGTTLTELHGIGDVLAAKILARAGAVTRFRSASASASYCSVAPIEVSSGDIQRHRLSRAGNRQLNHALHVMAITRTQRQTPGRYYYQRKRAAGKTHKKALRCLKRRLADAVYRTMVRDTETSLLPTA